MPEQVDLDAQRMKSLVPLYISIAGITTAVFIGDLLTPLGVAIWILYVVPLGMTLFDRNPMQPINVALVITVLMVITVFTDQPGMTAWVAYANRGFGAAVVWTVAVLARGLILTRLGLASEEWVRRVQTSLLERLQGEHNVSELGERALNILRGAVNAPAAAMYAAAGADFRLVASQGVEHGNALPATFRRGDGLVGLAAREKQVTVLKDLPEGYFALKSAFATGSPRHVAICPAVIDNITHGVLEFAFVHPPEARALDLLERSRDGVAAALRSAVYRERLQALARRNPAAIRRAADAAGGAAGVERGARRAEPRAEDVSGAARAAASRARSQQRAARGADAGARAAETCVVAVTRRSRAREPIQVGVPRQHVARAAHAAEQRAHSREAAGAEQGRPSVGGRGPLRGNDLLRGQQSADAHQRHPRSVEDRGGRRRVAARRRRTCERRRGPSPYVPADGRRRPAAVFHRHRAGTPDTINTDSQRLQQILTNLLSNAFKFTESGSVSLRVRPGSGGDVEFAVRDTGVGIPTDKLDVIFQAFRQADGSTHRKYGGTGLGLSISLELARALGGDIRVDSRVGAGSTFTLTLPSRFAAQPARRATPALATAGARKTQPPAPAGPDRQLPVGPANVRAGAIADDRNARRRPGD